MKKGLFAAARVALAVMMVAPVTTGNSTTQEVSQQQVRVIEDSDKVRPVSPEKRGRVYSRNKRLNGPDGRFLNQRQKRKNVRQAPRNRK
jgi:hypothetical protein